MGAPVNLPLDHLAVLEAMTRPDPAPRTELDSPAQAIARRVPGFTDASAADILETLNALGLTDVPYVRGMVSPSSTASPRAWITERGWEVLGMEAIAPWPN